MVHLLIDLDERSAYLMLPQEHNNIIECADCQFKGSGNPIGGSAPFLLIVGILAVSLFYLPLIILALVLLFWILFSPVKFSCPECGGKNTKLVELETNN